MIKLLAIGFWVCIASLGSSYVVASMRSDASEPATAEPTYFVGLDYKKTDSITVPIIAKEAIQGYVLARFVYTIDGKVASSLAVPPDPFILDEAFRAVYSASGFDFEHPEHYDLPALTASIRDSINKRFGQDLLHDVLVDQFDFLPKNEIGGEKLRTPKK